MEYIFKITELRSEQILASICATIQTVLLKKEEPISWDTVEFFKQEEFSVKMVILKIVLSLRNQNKRYISSISVECQNQCQAEDFFKNKGIIFLKAQINLRQMNWNVENFPIPISSYRNQKLSCQRYNSVVSTVFRVFSIFCNHPTHMMKIVENVQNNMDNLATVLTLLITSTDQKFRELWMKQNKQLITIEKILNQSN